MSEKSCTVKKVSKESRDREICTLYKNNELVSAIAKKLNINRHTVVRVLRKNGIYDKAKSKYHLNSEKIRRNEEIISLYMSGLSFRQIAKEVGLWHSAVEHVVKTYIDCSPTQYTLQVDNKDNIIRHRKYEFDIDFFNEINTEEKAYWLGFLYADGCISKDAVKLSLQSSDLQHLLKFRDALGGFDKEPVYREHPSSYTIYFNSKKMIQDLQRLGCTKRKTYTLRFPSLCQVPRNLIHHFMRGYFDGDGCVHFHPKIKSSSIVSVVGNTYFIRKYQEMLYKGIKKTTTTAIKPCKESPGIASFFIGGNQQVKKIYNFFYKDATVFLERKKEKFEIVIGRLKTSSQKSLDD